MDIHNSFARNSASRLGEDGFETILQIRARPSDQRRSSEQTEHSRSIPILDDHVAKLELPSDERLDTFRYPSIQAAGDFGSRDVENVVLQLNVSDVRQVDPGKFHLESP